MTHQTILNKWGVPHQEYQDYVACAERAWLAVIDPVIKGMSPINTRIFLDYAMFGMTGACAERMIVTGILAKQSAGLGQV